MNNQGPELQPPPRRSFGPFRRILHHFERTLGAGILVMLPIGITILVLKFFFDLLNPLFEPATDLLPGREVAGLGLAALLILVYVVGLVAAFVLGRRVISLGHRIMEVIPIVKGIYGTTRAAVTILSNNSDHRYSGVVLIDFPRPGIKFHRPNYLSHDRYRRSRNTSGLHPHHSDTILGVSGNGSS